ncbi:secretory phospholipase A2 receptor-like isoform X1, partial [Silurus asotus]
FLISELTLHIILKFSSSGMVSLILCVPHKYYLIQQGKVWSEAQNYCQAIHTDIAVIKSHTDLVQLQNEAQRQQFSSSAWIGFYNDINTWRWSHANEPLGSITFWFPPEPNNWHGEESCGMISSWGWNDLNCARLFPFVCFDGKQTGSNRYIYISSAMSWLQAQSYCRQSYTDLASIHNATENSVIQGIIRGETWFGLFRDTWKWTDPTNFRLSWIIGQPDNYFWNENCGYINNGAVGDALCSDKKPFFCYSG